MNLHYKTSFEIEPSIQNNDTWHGLVRIVREWIKSKLNLSALLGDWFFNGGTVSYSPNTVTTKRFYEQRTAQNFWALRFEEIGSGEYNMYKFITDIGIEEIISNQRFRFSIRIRYAVQAGYVGYEPEIQISCPNLVKTIISHTDYSIYLGHLRLNDPDFDSYDSSFACVLKSGEGHKFLDLLQNERYCPVILISRTSENQLQLDAKRLSHLLAGSAMVFVESADSFGDVNRELIDMKPSFEEYRCQYGMVRVYKPELDFTNPVDYKRHRFFSSRTIDEEGPNTIVKYIFRAVLNRSFQYESEYIFSISDVERKESRSRIEKLKREGGDSQELNQLYEEELAKLGQEKDWWEQTALQGDSDKEQLQEENRKLEEKVKALQYQLNQQNAIDGTVSDDMIVIDIDGILRKFAERTLTPRFCLDIIAREFSSRVTVLPTAYDSADRSEDFRYCPRLLEMLSLLCSKGYETLLQQEGSVKTLLEGVLGKNQYAARESETIENNKRARQERTFLYNGQSLEMLSHLKIGTADNTSETIRVHFEWDTQRQKFIIGYCGRHLFIP